MTNKDRFTFVEMSDKQINKRVVIAGYVLAAAVLVAAIHSLVATTPTPSPLPKQPIITGWDTAIKFGKLSPPADAWLVWTDAKGEPHIMRLATPFKITFDATP